MKEFNEYKRHQRALEAKLDVMQVQLFQVTAAAVEANARSSSDAAPPPTSGTGSPSAQYEVWSHKDATKTDDKKNEDQKTEDRETFHDAMDAEKYVFLTGEED